MVFLRLLNQFCPQVQKHKTHILFKFLKIRIIKIDSQIFIAAGKDMRASWDGFAKGVVNT